MLDKLGEAISHRGPDGRGTALLRAAGRKPVGLVHRRLSIIDLSSAAAQPMSLKCDYCCATDADKLVLIFNGEIYNFPALRSELIAAGHQFKSNSDSEVLLHLYTREGTSLPKKLNGIFAFAIYDGRETGRPPGIEEGDILIVRDQLGVKPLYHASIGEGFVFASELKALLRVPGISREIDTTALHQHLAYLWTPAPRTMLRDVKKLEAGNALIARDGRIARHWCYYDIPYGAPQITGRSADIAVDLARKFQVAVERQLISDVPIGAFLSGGLDSSAVVAMMRRAGTPAGFPCYSIDFPTNQAIDGSPPDLPYAQLVSRHLGVELRTVTVGSEMISELDRMLYALDEPQADPAPINALLIADRAKADGIKVLLSGAGGDDIFSGYRRHQALRAERLWGALPWRARRFVAATARRSAAGRGLKPSNPWRRRLVKMFEHADLDADRRTVAYFWWSGEAMRRELYSTSFAEAVAGEDASEPLLRSLARIPQERDPINRMLYLETKHFLADHNLNYTDKTGMASGVEVRVPLLDIDLVDYAARIPASLKQKGTTSKYIFRMAMEPYLPREVIHRTKTGFGAPLRYWLRNELRERVDETLSTSVLEKRGFFSPGAVRRLIELDRAGRVDGAYTIFALMCFEIWCRLFVDSSAS